MQSARQEFHCMYSCFCSPTWPAKCRLSAPVPIPGPAASEVLPMVRYYASGKPHRLDFFAVGCIGIFTLLKKTLCFIVSFESCKPVLLLQVLHVLNARCREFACGISGSGSANSRSQHSHSRDQIRSVRQSLSKSRFLVHLSINIRVFHCIPLLRIH